jgi:hypothetical protein
MAVGGRELQSYSVYVSLCVDVWEWYVDGEMMFNDEDGDRYMDVKSEACGLSDDQGGRTGAFCTIRSTRQASLESMADPEGTPTKYPQC